MAGAKYRPVSLGGKSRYFNVLFLVKDLKRLEKIAEIDGHEPSRIGGERKMIPHIVGSQLSYQIIKEFIFWK